MLDPKPIESVILPAIFTPRILSEQDNDIDIFELGWLIKAVASTPSACHFLWVL